MEATIPQTSIRGRRSLQRSESLMEKIRSFETARVWRVSPLGLELIVDPEAIQFSVGQVVCVNLRYGMSTTSLSGLVIVKVANELGNRILGIRLVERTPTNSMAPTDGIARDGSAGNNSCLCALPQIPHGTATSFTCALEKFHRMA